MKKFVVFVFAFLGLQVALFVSALTRVPAAVSFIASGYLAHFAAFSVTTFLASALFSHRFINVKYPFLAAFIYSFACAVGIEFLQRSLTNYRMFDYWDMAAGIAGSLVCIVFCKLLIHFWKEQPIF